MLNFFFMNKGFIKGLLIASLDRLIIDVSELPESLEYVRLCVSYKALRNGYLRKKIITYL